MPIALPRPRSDSPNLLDLAATEQSGTSNPDWTVGVKMGETQEGRFIVSDVVRFRGTPDTVSSTIVVLMPPRTVAWTSLGPYATAARPSSLVAIHRLAANLGQPW